MKNLKTSLIAVAIGIAFSASALGQDLSQHDAADIQIGIEVGYQSAAAPILLADASHPFSAQTVEADSPAAVAANVATAARLDAMYETAKLQCGTYAIDSRAYCLNQMKAGFGRL